MPIPNSRGNANLVMKCKVCKNPGHITIAETKKLTSSSEDDVETEEIIEGPLVTLECRGLEILEYKAMNLLVVGKSGSKFEDVDLSDTWCEYDEKKKVNIMCDNTTVSIIRNKSK